MKALLKVYPSKFWQDQVTIIGNREGLLKLKFLIDETLKTEVTHRFDFYEDDAHGDKTAYQIMTKVILGDSGNDEFLKLPAHYLVEDEPLNDEEIKFLKEFMMKETEKSQE